MKILTPVLSVVLVAWALSGCSNRQVFNAGAGWRQNECQKILDSSEHARCLQSANTDYETYEKEKAAGGAK